MAEKKAPKKTASKTQFKKGAKRSPKAGRKKGTKNKTTVAVKEGIMQAFQELGGVNYLVAVGKEDPKTFCSLLGKVIPAEINAELNLSGNVQIIVDTGITNRPPLGIHKSKIIDHESTSKD